MFEEPFHNGRAKPRLKHNRNWNWQNVIDLPSTETASSIDGHLMGACGTIVSSVDAFDDCVWFLVYSVDVEQSDSAYTEVEGEKTHFWVSLENCK